MKYFKISLIFLLVSVSSCSAQSSSDVFLSLEKDYPASRYLVAVGEGDTRRDAEKNASAKLSLIFESRIDVSQSLNEYYEEFSNDETSTLKYESKTNKRTNVQSNQKLINVKYGKHSVDEVGNNFVVAYINRSETASIYDEMIENNNSSIIALERTADNSTLKIKKYAALNSASGKMNKNIVLMKQLSIISPYNPDFSDKILTYENIYRKKGEVASSIKFVISTESDADVVNTLKSLLTSKGFKIAKSSDFLITATMKYEEIDLGRKEIFYGWFVNVELMNAEHELIFNFEKSGREGGITESAVYSRAKFSANKSLKKNFVLGFEQYLNSLLGN